MQIKLDNSIMECFHYLDKACSEDDLEDLLHFAVDSYQFCGVHIACDEIDIDQVQRDPATAPRHSLMRIHRLS